MPLISENQIPRGLDLLDLMKNFIDYGEGNAGHHRGAMRSRDDRKMLFYSSY
jgi:hypothetical protein